MPGQGEALVPRIAHAGIDNAARVVPSGATLQPEQRKGPHAVGCLSALLAVSLVLSQPPGAIAHGETSRQEKQAPGAIPRPDHVVIVFEENKAYGQIIGNMAAQYINQLASDGASFANSFAITHPSQPNYLALFSGSTHGVPDDRCPISVSGDNLAIELGIKGMSFGAYSESMPRAGYRGCRYGHYFRKHNPAVNWQNQNVAPETNMPFDMFPSDYSKLPTVSIVVPDQTDDMHDGKTLDASTRGDRWLKKHLDPYVRWAKKNNSLLIVTWDEDDDSGNNRIATIFVGPMVKPGTYSVRIDHYGVLRTILEMYGLTPIGHSAEAKPVVEVWKRAGAP